MLRKIAPLFIAGGIALFVSGCASGGGRPAYEPPNASFTGEPGTNSHLATIIYEAARVLAERAVYLDKSRAIIVATVVSVDDLEQSSTFGRLTSQLVANRIAQRGYLVSDVTYMHAVTLQPGTGELVLTREAAKASADVNAQAVVAGTYAVGGREIYLNLRMLNAKTGEMLSSADAVIPLDDNVAALFPPPPQQPRKITYDRFEDLARQGHIIE